MGTTTNDKLSTTTTGHSFCIARFHIASQNLLAPFIGRPFIFRIDLSCSSAQLLEVKAATAPQVGLECDRLKSI